MVEILFYFGGVAPTYFKARDRGMGRLAAALNAVTWPFGVGVYVARNFCEMD